MPRVERLLATQDMRGRMFLLDGRAVKFLGIAKHRLSPKPMVVYSDPVTNVARTYYQPGAAHDVLHLDFLGE